MVSCCGTPADSSSPQTTHFGDTDAKDELIVHQPSPIPGPQAQKRDLQQPSIPVPPLVHQNGGNVVKHGGHQSPVTLNGSSPPQSPSTSQYSAITPHSPTPPPAAYNGNNSRMSQSLLTVTSPTAYSPVSSHQRTDSSSVLTPVQTSQIVRTSVPGTLPSVDEGRMAVSIDFGTTFSGVAYGSSRIAAGRVQQILHWPGASETFRKIPTCLLYDGDGQVLAWGLQAKNSGPMPGLVRCEWFKLYLEPRVLRGNEAIDSRLPRLPPGKTALDVIVDFLSCLWSHAKQEVTREIGAVADLNSAEVWLTVPAAWDAAGCDMMREAAIRAGFVQSAYAGDRNWRDRLHIVTEPEAAAVHCAHLTDVHRLKPGQNFLIVDAGGGTIDLAVYKILGQLANLEIAEICARSGQSCGSLFLDLRFRELVKTLLADHPAHLDAASLASFMYSFSETDKLEFQGENDDNTMFRFTCFNVEDPHDSSVGLINGELVVPGNLLRREVFDPVVSQALALIDEQIKKVKNQEIHALLMVGGFSGSDYLFSRVQEQFGSRIRLIARPSDMDTATLRGAAQYGLSALGAKRPVVSSVVAPRSYLMKVKLPAEPEDWQKRPAYTRQNNHGAWICENRVQYLVQKGAILRKGQRVITKFCKFSQNPQDSTFVAVLFTSDADTIFRYTDEGETTELCKWAVDLAPLPSFRQNASIPHPSGFYTDFELGLELDSAEVRGILLYEGQERGRVVFDFLN